MSDYEWLRSSLCASGACVEVALGDDGSVLVRDSKRGDDSPVLSFTSGAWARVLEDITYIGLPDGAGWLTDGGTYWGRLEFTADEWHAFVEDLDAFTYDKLSVPPVPVAADPTIGEALCADGIHEADGPCCSAGAAAPVPGSSRRAPEQRACRVCGCTDDAACEGGCWWVPDPSGAGDLCSTCALASRRAQEPEGFTARYDAACDAVKAAGYAFGVEQANMLLIGLRAADRPAGESQASEPARPAPVAAQPRYILDKDAILELVERYGEACLASDWEQAAGEFDAIRAALTPVPASEPEPAWGSGPLVKHVTETPADPTPPEPSYPAGICRCGADGHGPGDNLCVCRSAS